MNRSLKLVLAGLVGVLAAGVVAADERYDREENQRYRDAMNRIVDDAFDTTDYYAAIAYSPSTGKYGYSYNFATLASAQRRALAQCKESDSKIVVWSRNAYCGLAKGNDNSYGAAYGTTAAQAKAKALAECRKQSTDCHVVECVFAGR